MLRKFTEKDFEGLRGPFESGRQSPAALGSILILAIFAQALLLFLEYYVSQYSTFPYIETIFSVHLWGSVVITLLSVLYAFPSIFMKNQKSQYFIIILVSQNVFGISTYLLALIILGTNESGFSRDYNSLISFTFATLIIGLLVFIVTCVRFYNLIKNGHYRKRGNKSERRQKFETKSYLPMAIIGGVGLVFILQYLIRSFSLSNIDTVFMITLLIFIFYTMIFVLPEQLVLLYCKCRFDSFNYSKNGNLYPLGRKGA